MKPQEKIMSYDLHAPFERFFLENFTKHTNKLRDSHILDLKLSKTKKRIKPLKIHHSSHLLGRPAKSLLHLQFMVHNFLLDIVLTLSPPQRLLLINTSERKRREAVALERENGSVGK